jgi:hypothetical protein
VRAVAIPARRPLDHAQDPELSWACAGPETKRQLRRMHSQRIGYRYYYGPLSARRDGRAMGCRELTQ